MNSVDIGILIIFGISCLAGLMRGFTREVLGLLTWSGSAFATYMILPLLRGVAQTYIANPLIADTIAAGILFIFFLIIFNIMSSSLANCVKRSNSLGSIDRALGTSFGVARSLLIVCSAEMILSTFTLRQNQADVIQESRFIPLIRQGSDHLIPWIPKNIRELIVKQRSETMAKTPHFPKLDKSLENILPHVIGKESLSKKPSGVFETILPQGQPLSEQYLPGSPSDKTQKPEEDMQKTAESLANLTPQAIDTKGNDGDYNIRQRRDLDRLVQINQ